MNKNLKRLALASSSLIAAAVLVACGGSGDDAPSTPIPTQMGTLSAALTDAPACGFDQVNVTVSKVRVHKSATAADTDSGWTDITLSPARKINLFNLTNGALEQLGQTPLAVGRYTQVRLVLDPNSGNALANSVVPTGAILEKSLDTPSAVQSGIKLNAEFDVAANQRTDLVIDFDACKSVVTKGNGAYALKTGAQGHPGRAERHFRIRPHGPAGQPSHGQRPAERRCNRLHRTQHGYRRILPGPAGSRQL